MPEGPSRRFFLADLVFAALLCGPIAALFLSPHGDTNAVLISALIGVVVTGWSLFHARRQAPTCEECGRRFIEPKKAVVPPESCPHCGRKQLVRAWSIARSKTVFWSLLGLVPLLVAAAVALISGLARGPYETIGMIGGLVALGGVPLSMLAMIGVGMYRSALMRPTDRPCEVCGSMIPAEPPPGPRICPQCRVRHLRPEEARKEQSRNLVGFVAVLGVLGFFGALLLPLAGGSSADGTSWITITLVVLGSIVAPFLALVVVAVAIQLLRHRRLRDERGAIAMAQKWGGRDGEIVEEGPSTIWYSGPDDPVPMLREQMEAARVRFQTLTGDMAVTQPPRRILVFHDRGVFLTFHRRILAGIDFASFDGIQLGLPYQLITLCTAPAPCRITDPERTIRSMAAYAMLDSIWGASPPGWLQNGLGRSVAGTDRDGLARLNRTMIAALARGTAWSVELFTTNSNSLTRLLRGSKDPGTAHKVYQFVAQAWSIVEYLCGEQAPHDQRAALGSFLRDPRAKSHQEESFRIYFGAGFAPFLDGWKQWVLDRGIGTYDPPPDRIRDGLLDRVLPAIRDGKTRRGDRIVAIREWASDGFVLGADALIDLLRQPGDIPKEEIVWALCMVSGMAWGDEPERWQTWWDDLPYKWGEPPEPAVLPSDGLPREPIATVDR